MTRGHLINCSDWKFLDHARTNSYANFNEGVTINFQDRFFPPKARESDLLDFRLRVKGGTKS